MWLKEIRLYREGGRGGHAQEGGREEGRGGHVQEGGREGQITVL